MGGPSSRQSQTDRNGVCQGPGEGKWGVFHGARVSALQNENVPEVDGGHGGTALGTDLTWWHSPGNRPNAAEWHT